MIRVFISIYFCFLFTSCISSKDTARFEIADGFYTSSIFGAQQKVYVDNRQDSIAVFALTKNGEFFKVDTTDREALFFPQDLAQQTYADTYFKTREIDFDLIAIPFKYRFPVASQAQQLSTNLNASFYTGYRTDFYSLKYRNNKFGQLERVTRHYGISVGGFSGFGSSPITPWFTNDMITEEYDGWVWSNGFAVSLGIDYLNIGFAVGWDRLLDSNSSSWIYHRKPWLGLVIGININ